MANIPRAMQLSVVESALAGDNGAFASLHKAYDHRLRKVLTSYSRNDLDQVDDILQATWMQVFRKLGQFRGDADLSTWLHRIAVNTALQHKRTPVERHKWSTDYLDETLPDDERAPRQELTYHDRSLDYIGDRDRLYRHIQGLPAMNRAVIGMRLQDFTFKEIAEHFGLPVGSVKSLWVRGLRMLRGRMGCL